MNMYCVICTYTTPEGVTLKAVTNDVRAETPDAAVSCIADILAEKGCSFLGASKVTQTGESNV